MLPVVIEPEVEPEHLGISGRKGPERRFDLVAEEPVHHLLFRIALVVGDEPLDHRPVAFGVERRVEPHLGGVECRKGLDHLEGKPGGRCQFLGCGLAVELLPQRLGGTYHPGKIGGAIEWHPDRPSMASQCCQDRLADPPHRVGNELDPLVGVEFPGRSEKADVALADEVGERQAPVLVLLGHRDHEPKIALHQLGHGLLVAGADAVGDGDLLLGREERGEAYLIEVLVEDVSVGIVDAEGLGGLRLPAAARPGRRGRCQDLADAHVGGDRRSGVGWPLGGSRRRPLWLALGRGVLLLRHEGKLMLSRVIARHAGLLDWARPRWLTCSAGQPPFMRGGRVAGA